MSTEALKIRVGGIDVDVVRKDIRNLHIGVYPPAGRVRVAAPRTMKADAVRLAVVTRLPWIKRHRSKFAQHEREPHRAFVSGETHLFMGRRYRLVRLPADRVAIKLGAKQRLEMYAPPDLTRAQVEKVLDQWYRDELRRRAAPLVVQWAQRMKVDPPIVTIRKMKTLWGSCSPGHGRITLNLQLIKLSPHCLDYVIAHEVAHFHEKGHGPRFTRVLDKAVPHWRSVRSELNSAALPDWR